MKKIIYIFLFIGLFSKANTPSIIFKENKGQWPEKVLFGTEFLNTKFYINKTCFNYCVYNFEELSKAYNSHDKKAVVHGHNYEVNFVGANLNSFQTKDQLTEYYNYFIGNDKSKWTSKVKASRFLEFNNIYNGIDLHVYSSGINLKYDLIISPNADPNQIKLSYNYADGIEIRNNELIIKTSVGEIIEKEPLTYQIINGVKLKVKCRYILLEDNTVGFAFPDGYNKNYELVIDPNVIVCSYSGTSTFASATTCNHDANGNVYLGSWADIGYPTTPGAFQVSAAGDKDMCVSVFNSNGTSKLFATYIGGNDFEIPIDIHISANEITVFGESYSTDYPVSVNAFDKTYNGSMDLVITKLDISGSNLFASTYVGGSLDEDLDQFNETPSSEMVVDKQKNVYIVSNTTSLDFPVTPGAFSTVMKGVSDAVVFKMDSALTVLKWSTYLGGTKKEDGIGIRTDGAGGAFIEGTTNSTDFPVTPGVYNPVINGSAWEDLFVSHINNTGTALIASTYLGTTTSDDALAIEVDPYNNVYVVGLLGTISPGFFIPTAGTYSTQSENTIYKLDSSLTNLSFKTLFGGIYPRPQFYPTAIQVDSCGIICMAGWAYVGQPTTPNKFLSFAGGGSDMYMIVFNPNCTSLRFASYYGGNGPAPTGWSGVGDYSWGKSHFDGKGILYLAISATENLPTTPGAYCANHNTTIVAPKIYNDAFLKVDLQTYVNAYSSYGTNIIGCPAPFTASFVGTTNTGSTFWNFGDGNTSVQDTISHTYLNFGTYNVLLVVTDTTTCNRTDSVKSVLNVVAPIAFDLGEDVYKCPNSPLLLNANATAVSYSWSTGQTTQNISVNQVGTYTLTVNNGGCNSSDEINVLMGEEALNNKFPNVITPNNDGVNDMIDFTKYKFTEVEFTLYDRWGKQRYTTTDPFTKWLPENLNNDTYFYVVNYRSNCTGKFATDKGFISVFK